MNTKQKMGMMAVSAIGVIGLATAGINYASAEDAARWPERNAAIKTALENNDYTAWKSAVGDADWAKNITQENFTTLRQIHELRLAGKFKEAQILAKANGLNPGNHKGMVKERKGKGAGYVQREAKHDAMVKAIEAGDFAAWKKLVGDRPMAAKITKENFAQFQKLHALIKAGDLAGAKFLAKELGLLENAGKGSGRGHGRGMGMGRLMNR